MLIFVNSTVRWHGIVINMQGQQIQLIVLLLLVSALQMLMHYLTQIYNASFKRLPDPDGLRYWIGNFSSGKDDERAVASSFLASDEFKQRYGEDVSNENYVNTLYKNVLERDADTGGLNYWLGQLNSGVETRYEVLLGFSESAENKGLFSETTGFYAIN